MGGRRGRQAALCMASAEPTSKFPDDGFLLNGNKPGHVLHLKPGGLACGPGSINKAIY